MIDLSGFQDMNYTLSDILDHPETPVSYNWKELPPRNAREYKIKEWYQTVPEAFKTRPPRPSIKKAPLPPLPEPVFKEESEFEKTEPAVKDEVAIDSFDESFKNEDYKENVVSDENFEASYAIDDDVFLFDDLFDENDHKSMGLER